MTQRPRSDFPTLNSQILHDYLSPEDTATHLRAGRRLFDHYAPGIEATVHERLRRRYGALANEVVQEAWLRCVTELRARKAELMQSPPKRPCVSVLMASHTLRAVWAMEQRARRQDARLTSLDEVHERPSAQRVADTDITPEDLHAILEAGWNELLKVSTVEQRDALLGTGAVLFFAGDWRKAGKGAQAELIAERVVTVRKILQRNLRERYGLKPDAIRRFVRWLLP